MHVLLLDKSDRVIYSNIDPACRGCLTNCLGANEITTSCGKKGRRRRGVIETVLGRAYVCTDSPDLIASSKQFRKVLSLHAAVLSTFSDIRQQLETDARKNAQRLLHNVTSLSAHILQELYSLVPQEKLLGGVHKQVEEIARTVTGNTRNAAYAYLKILKNATAMKTEFSVVDRLWSGAAQKQLQLRPHNLHRVFLNIASVFFLEFQEKGVKLDIASPPETIVLIDYEALSVALYHLLHNSVKYTSHNSNLDVTFSRSDSDIAIKLQMHSLHIYPHERDRVFDDFYSGEIPRKLSKEGSGVGLGIARALLRLHGGDLVLHAGGPEGGMGGASYSTNVFELRFPANPRAQTKASISAKANA